MRQDFLFEIYHENSKLSFWDWEQLSKIWHINTSGQFGLVADAPSIDIRCLETIPLPKPNLPDISLRQVLESRRSAMEFQGGSLPLERLSAMLHFSGGFNGAYYENGAPVKPLRFYPSPGALYPLSILVEVLQVEDLNSGLYYYDPREHALGQMAADMQALSTATTQNNTQSDCSCRLWLFSQFDRLTFKYGERSYRFALLEAGHIAQNVLLVSTALNIPARPMAGFLDDMVIQAAHLESFELVPLYFIAIGS